MSVCRQATRVVAVGALLGGLVAVGALPAYADSDRVRVRASGAFSAGGSPGAVSIEVRKRSAGCVSLRTALGLSLTGVGADQVRVEVQTGGRWSSVPVSGDGGVVRVSRTSSAAPPLCRGKSSTVRYRVAFLAGAPAGRLAVVGEATTAVGRLIGRGTDTSRVGGRAAGTPTPSPTPTRKPTPTPVASTPVPATEPVATQAVLAASPAGRAAAAETSGGSMIMYAGIALVVLGAGLIALLIFRSRADRARARAAGADHAPAAGPADFPAVPQPRNPGPTTYRSGVAVPGPPPPPAGQVYGGQQPPAGGQVYGQPQPQPSAPARPGSLYGAPGTYPAVTPAPAPRPAGGVYGARPASAPDHPASAPPSAAPSVSARAVPVQPVAAPPAPPVSAQAVSVPPVPAPPVSASAVSAPSVSAPPVSAPPVPAPGVPVPPAPDGSTAGRSAAAPQAPSAAVPPAPARPVSVPPDQGRSAPTPTAGGGSTTIMPQLPG
ncbi:hypothetical protein AB0C22_12085 [Micromonospora sp. NPDC048894]|uniref:hypothetical protein n=1 Tax=Micromonospora sp. NPDC048894 TaxID=3155493 RepID=UPI00340FC1E4